MEQPAASSGVDLFEAFSRLQALTLSSARVGDFLSELAALAPQLGRQPLSASVTLRGEHDPFTVASSDEFANRVDEVQYDKGEGPCLEALRTGREIYVPELRADTRWSRYREHAVASGVRSSLSLPLPVSGTTIGALNVYCTQPEAFDERSRQSLSVFAAQAAGALAMVLRHSRQDQITSQLEQALASRTVIDQAMGIIMAQQRCTADEAFGLLRAHSQNTNRKLRDVAAEVIERVSGAPPKAPRPFSP